MDIKNNHTEISLLLDKQIEYETRITKLEKTVKRLVCREEI